MKQWVKARASFSILHTAFKSDTAYQAGQTVLNDMIQKIRQAFPAPCPANPCPAPGPLPVPPPVLTNLVIYPEQLLLGIGQSSNITVLASYSDGSVVDITTSPD
jgi:hypothetical protein